MYLVQAEPEGIAGVPHPMPPIVDEGGDPVADQALDDWRLKGSEAKYTHSLQVNIPEYAAQNNHTQLP